MGNIYFHTPQQLYNGDIIVIGNSSLIYQAMATETSNASSRATDTQAQTPDQLTNREIADQPTDVAIPAQPKATAKPLSSEAGALPLPGTHPILAEATTRNAPGISPIHSTPAPVMSTPAYAVPQVAPAQGYMASGASYATAPGFSPAGAATGMQAQPGYPAYVYAPGGYVQAPGQFQAIAGARGKTPGAQKRERMLRWLVALIVALLLLGASNIGTYAFARATTPKPVVRVPTFPSPQKALETYCQGVMTGNSEEIYDLLSDEAKVHTSLDDVQKIFDELKLLDGSFGGINAQYSNCGFDDIRTNNSLAVATILLSVTITIQLNTQGQKQPQTMTETDSSLTSLVWEHNQWKIDFNSLLQAQPKLSVVGSTTSIM